ncbi:MAG: (2Fe-2S)-binding protein [Xanthomonadales bacterium]|nr:(2Fe-2S)-binding protein [Xanthomonadales bacterium]
MSTKLTVNGKAVELDVPAEMPLLWALRDHLQLTGTKYGCGISQCGACTVHVDGKPRRACVTPLSSVAGSSVTTIEGVDGPEAKAVREAWKAIDVPQCGYCQSGQIMSAVDLLKNNPQPSDEDIDKAMDGNLCRCATYVRIRRAIKDASAALG